MQTKLSEPVSVNFSYNHKDAKVEPRWILWNNRLYKVSKIGLHHTYRKGRTLFHVFSVSTNTLFFRLILDTDTLAWRVEEITDGSGV